ncbi:phosphate acetyltransferase [uncultured Paracoccus sp.]|uniref:phosphate acetyltransferase n=1 Tax=uncultured Paracoccus sp. TaxID=189685 RepID=UPI0026288334|nr:phosphate acetyltransferase [uncultured Paracoccus sp.]
MNPLDRIIETARARRAHIILPEGRDPRVREAAARVVAEGIARITLLDGEAPGAASIDSATALDLPELAATWHDLRKGKGLTAEAALDEVRDPIRQAAIRVRLGQADGTVGGAVATTSDTVRAALQAIGRAPGVRIVSSFFLMLPPEGRAPRTETSMGSPTDSDAAADAGTHTGRNVEDAITVGVRGLAADPLKSGMIFADCGLVIAPDAAELADIAIAAAGSCQRLLEQTPRVALLSFSTAGSAEHPSLGRIREALALVRERMPKLEIDGELQFDAALDEEVRAKKAPRSRLTGPANVFIFPDLASGNIGYKIAQRLGGLTAVGPILQGLARPANDLSRGCSVQDIIAAVAVTAVQ